MKRDKLLKSKGYNFTKIQNELFRQLDEYIKIKGITRTQFAKELGVSKGYVSQILNGNFDFKLSKLVELSLAIGKIPEIKFNSLEEVKNKERKVETTKQKIFLVKGETAEYKFRSSKRGIYVSSNFGFEVRKDSNYINSLMN